MTERKNRVATTEAILDLLGIGCKDANIISVDLHMDAENFPVLTIVSYVKGDITHSKRTIVYKEITEVGQSRAIADYPEQYNTYFLK